MGDLDVLVANTGGLIERSRAVDMSLALWEEVMAVNMTSTFLCCRAALKHMEPRKKGSLILVSSLAGHNGGGPGATHYGASKGAMITYTRGLAKEVGPLGIRVNGIAPGLVDTKMTKVTTSNPKRLEGAIDRIPLKRLGTPADMAGAALFLASPLASYIVGQTLVVDGGLIL